MSLPLLRFIFGWLIVRCFSVLLRIYLHYISSYPQSFSFVCVIKACFIFIFVTFIVRMVCQVLFGDSIPYGRWNSSMRTIRQKKRKLATTASLPCFIAIVSIRMLSNFNLSCQFYWIFVLHSVHLFSQMKSSSGDNLSFISPDKIT